MKFLAKMTIGSEEANAAIWDVSMMEKMQRILDEIMPEAVYFAAENGRRTQYMVVNMDSPQQLQAVVEPWWLLFNADIISVLPIFTLQDMEAMGPALKDIVKKMGVRGRLVKHNEKKK